MRVADQPAFVLHYYPYRETSLLLEVFTRHYGRLGLIAKGARRPKSEIKPVLSPFQPLLLGWSGKGDLATLTQAEPATDSLSLAGSALFCGFYLNELMMRLLVRHDANEAVFEVYQTALTALQAGCGQEAALRVFEKRLLQELGYGLVLDCEVEGNRPIRPDANYAYIVERGPVPAAVGQTGRNPVLSGSSLLALKDETFNDSQTLAETKALLRAVITHHIGDKPLHARRLFQKGRPAIGDRP